MVNCPRAADILIGAPTVVLCDGQCDLVARGQIAAPDDGHRAVMARRRAGDLGPDQQPRQVIRACLWRDALKQRQGSDMKQAMQQSCLGFQTGDNAKAKPRLVKRRVAHERRQDGVVFEGRKHIAGHIGGKAGDGPVAHRDPFAVGAGHDEQSLTDARSHRANDLGFLAAHDVGGASGVASQTGDEMKTAAIAQPMSHQRVGQGI